MDVDLKEAYIGVDFASREDFNVVRINNIATKRINKEDRLFAIMRRVKKYRVKKKLAKRIIKLTNKR